MKLATIFLAAGHQYRFGERLGRKCMTEINGISTLERLCEMMSHHQKYLVISDMWTLREADQALEWGVTIVKPAKYETIGQSIAAGLRATDADEVLVISADTFVIKHDIFIPSKDEQFVYDPIEHITIWRLNREWQLKIEQYPPVMLVDRVKATAFLGMRGRLAWWKWWLNINTRADLKRARRLENDSS